MLRALSLALLALLLAVPAVTAGQDLAETADPCEKWSVCPILRVQPDPLLVCAGVGLGLQGAVVCAYERWDGNTCAVAAIGFHQHDSCTITDRIGWSVDTDGAALP